MSVNSSTVKRRQDYCRMTQDQMEAAIEYLSRRVCPSGEEIGEVRFEVPQIFTHLEEQGMLYARYCRLIRQSTGCWDNLMLIGYMEHGRDDFVHQRLIEPDELARLNQIFNPAQHSTTEDVINVLNEPRVMISREDPPIIEIRYESPFGQFMIPLEIIRPKKEANRQWCTIL